MKARRFWIGIVVVLVLAAIWFRHGEKSLRSERFTLSNGLEFIVIPYGEVPAVTHIVWYKVGAKDERPGKTGVAHFLEHLMFKGTVNLKPGEFSEIVARLGGNENAITSQDYTVYFQNIARQHLERVMELEADRMRHLNFDDTSFKNEQQVVLEERSSRIENSPRARLMEQMNAALFGAHPYGHPVIGWRPEITALTPEDARQFYGTWYAPNNAVVVVAGNITARELKPLAEKYYGALPSSIPPSGNKPTVPEVSAPHTIQMSHEAVIEPEWIRSYIAPSAAQGDTDLSLPLSVLAYVLGGSETSRLYQELAVTQGVIIDAATFYDPVAAEHTSFMLHVFPKTTVSPTKLDQSIEGVITNIKEHGITHEELERAKSLLRANVIFSRDSFQEMAFMYGKALVAGLPISYVERFTDRIDSVTAEQVKKAASEILIRERSVTGLLVPQVTRKKKP